MGLRDSKQGHEEGPWGAPVNGTIFFYVLVWLQMGITLL